jgi:hypothetical protein
MRLTIRIPLMRAKQAYKREGLYYLIRISLIEALGYLGVWYYRLFKSSETFEFQGKHYHYLFHPYNSSWRSERAALIPIFWDIVKRYQEKNKRILEVGNTLSYVYKVNHDILDKYEIVDGVINEDVVEFHPSTQYDLIISVLSIDAVGRDENVRDAMKTLHAINNLENLLAPGGQMVLSLKIGYNTEMNKLFRNGIIHFDKQYYLKRISCYRWQEVSSFDDIKDLKFDYSIPTPNGVVIGVITKKQAYRADEQRSIPER